MNIFILSPNIELNAQYHCDKHVVKMIAESTQMLVTALHLAGNHSVKGSEVINDILGVKAALLIMESPPLPCKPLGASMTKHPCTQWTCASIENFNYLAQLAVLLCKEHQHRWPMSPCHEYYPWLLALQDALLLRNMALEDANDVLNFAVAVKSAKFRSTATFFTLAVDIYRSYYALDKHSFATWTKRETPEWYNATIQGCNVPSVYYSLKAELDAINSNTALKS